MESLSEKDSLNAAGGDEVVAHHVVLRVEDALLDACQRALPRKAHALRNRHATQPQLIHPKLINGMFFDDV